MISARSSLVPASVTILKSPIGELACPVLECGFRDDDKMGSGDIAVGFEVGKEGDGLESFTEAHLVGEDTVEAVVMQRHHPVQALQLVAAHQAVDVYKGLKCEDDPTMTTLTTWRRLEDERLVVGTHGLVIFLLLFRLAVPRGVVAKEKRGKRGWSKYRIKHIHSFFAPPPFRFSLYIRHRRVFGV
jgi:hypothetical protein